MTLIRQYKHIYSFNFIFFRSTVPRFILFLSSLFCIPWSLPTKYLVSDTSIQHNDDSFLCPRARVYVFSSPESNGQDRKRNKYCSQNVTSKHSIFKSIAANFSSVRLCYSTIHGARRKGYAFICLSISARDSL